MNSGIAIVGNFGSKKFFDYTAHGDAVNATARLEAANKHFGTRLCVSSNTAGRIEGFLGRPIGRLLLKGRSTGILAYEPLSQVEFYAESNQRYLEAFEAMDTDSENVEQMLDDIVRDFPEEHTHLAAYHPWKTRAGEMGTRIRIA